MPAVSHKISLRLRAIGFALASGAMVFSSIIAVAEVLVVTDSHSPVQSSTGTRVIELDLPTRIEAELAADLPADPVTAAALVQQRLQEGSPALQHRLIAAYQNLADAWGLGVAKIPAVIVDRRYVIYGEPDVARAIALIDAYRNAQR